MVSRGAASSLRLLNHAWNDDADEHLGVASSRVAEIPDRHSDLRIVATDGWCGTPDDGEEPIGYRLVLSLLVVLCCGVCAIAFGVLAGISWINGWSWSATALVVASASLASIAAITKP
jgi:hypothetical protein